MWGFNKIKGKIDMTTEQNIEQTIEQNIEQNVDETIQPPEENVENVENVENTETIQPPEETVDETAHKNGFKKRVDKLNAKIAEREAEIAYWREQVLKTQQSTPPAAPAVDNKRPVIADFDDIDKYTDALTDWKVEQALLKKEAEQRTTSVIKTYENRLNEFKNTVDDFDEAISDVSHIPVSQEISNIIIESEVGPQLAYYLAKNEQEITRINNLPPHRRLVELGKLEAKLTPTDTSSAKNEQNVSKKQTKAPTPVKSVSPGGVIKKDLSDPNLSQAEYRALRQASMKKKW